MGLPFGRLIVALIRLVTGGCRGDPTQEVAHARPRLHRVPHGNDRANVCTRLKRRLGRRDVPKDATLVVSIKEQGDVFTYTERRCEESFCEGDGRLTSSEHGTPHGQRTRLRSPSRLCR